MAELKTTIKGDTELSDEQVEYIARAMFLAKKEAAYLQGNEGKKATKKVEKGRL